MHKAEVEFWSSTEYSGFLAGLIRELNESGFEAKQRFQISEASYRSAKSTPARLWLRFRQYVVYPMQLCCVLLGKRVGRFKRSNVGKVSEPSNLNTFQLSHIHDVCVVSTNTFYAPLLATYLHPNVVHLVYDLFPEAMIHSGKWQESTLKVKLVRWVTKQTLKRAKVNVFLGQRLQEYVELIHGPVENAAIIAVGADQALFGRSPVERLGRLEGGDLRLERCVPVSRFNSQLSDSRTVPTILYCGNFGNMHESETLFEYWNNVSDSFKGSDLSVKDDQIADHPDLASPSTSLGGTKSPLLDKEGSLNEDSDSLLFSETFPPSHFPTFNFCCSGPKRLALEAELVQLPQTLQQHIQLGGGLDQAEWVRTMESADVALVTMVPGSETVVMPSKTYSAMMAGQAILAIAPEDSDLVDTIKAANCGWFVEPGDVGGLARAVSEICSDAEMLLEKRENAFQYAHAHFGQDALAQRWLDVIEQVSGISV